MRQPVHRIALSVGAAAALVFGVAGCSKSVGKDDVAKTIQSKLNAQMSGHKVTGVTCDQDLKAEVDASTKCTAKIDGKAKHFQAVVTKVDGTKVHYTIKIADQGT